MDNLHELRKSYSEHGLDESQLNDDPIVTLKNWLRTAQDHSPGDWFEVNAMTLATTDQAGWVTARTVLLKSLENDELVFFTNYDSEKGQQISANPQGALLFFWPHLHRQIRIEGPIGRTTRAVSEKYFHSRPRGSQISAAISRQSEPVAHYEELARKAEALEAELGDAVVPCPDNWGGFALLPQRIEFWQGRVNRLHDRFQYFRDADRKWFRQRLAP